MPVLRRAFYAALALYLAICLGMGIFQRSFLYNPAPDWEDPGAHGLPQAERITLAVQDGTVLQGWWIKPRREDAPVFLYFHGNSGGLDRRAGRFGLMAADGSGVLAFSYRGYGGSGGKPGEAALHADAAAIYTELVKTVAPSRIILFGESLGTGVALNLSRKVEARAVILDSPYLSILRLAEMAYPWLPVSWLLVDTYRSDLWIGAAKAPVLILHGALDTLIPPVESERLAALGQPGKVKRIVYPGEKHVVFYNRGPDRDVPAFLMAIKAP